MLNSCIQQLGMSLFELFDGRLGKGLMAGEIAGLCHETGAILFDFELLCKLNNLHNSLKYLHF